MSSGQAESWTRLMIMVLAVALAGLATFGLFSPSVGRLGRLGRPGRARSWSAANAFGGGHRSREAPLWRWWTELTRPRPDAVEPIPRLLLTSAVSLAIAVVLALAGSLSLGWSLVIAVILTLCGYVLLGRFESPASRRRRHRMIIELPHLLDLISACLRAGLPLRSGVRAALEVADGPLADDLGQVMISIELGVGEAEAWRSIRGHPVLGRLAVDLARSVESGTMIVDTLRQHARNARRRRRGALEARARTVGVHSVPPLMVCFLPAFLLIGVVPTGVSAFLHALG